MNQPKRPLFLLFILVLALAVFLRVRHLDTTRIWSDQAFTLTTAMRWVNGGRMPLAANKSSIGVMNPPMIEYLYAAALRCWPDILSVAVLTMVSGVIAIVATGWATYRTLGQKTAFWAVLIFAVNPWSVHYSQLIWNQTMIPLFASLTLACLLLYFVVDQRPVLLILSFVWAACMTQVHPGSAIQLLTMVVVGVLFWRRLKPWPLLVGGAAFLLLYAPFLLYESGVGWADVRAALDVGAQSGSLSPAAVLVSLDLMHAKGLLSTVDRVASFDALATGLFVLALGSVIYQAVRDHRRRHRTEEATRRLETAVILLLWLALPVLFYLRSSHYLQIYYLMGQLPAHFILVSMGLAGLHRKLTDATSSLLPSVAPQAVRRVVWAMVYVPLIALLGWQAAFDLQVQDHRQTAADGEAQIRHFRAAIQTSRQLLNRHEACTLVALSHGHNVETSELSILREFVSRERVLLADGELALPLPAPCAFYLDTQATTRASTWLRNSTDPLTDETIPVLGERWRFFDLGTQVRTDEVEDSGSPSTRVGWENGVALTGYERGSLRPNATLPLTLTWSVEEDVPENVYHFGTYLLTDEDQVIAQSDGPGFDSIQWRAGDAFITWFDIAVPEDVPPADYRIAVALYTWPAVEPVSLRTGGTLAYLERITYHEVDE